MIINHGEIIVSGQTRLLPAQQGYKSIEEMYLGLTGYTKEREEIEQTFS